MLISYATLEHTFHYTKYSTPFIYNIYNSRLVTWTPHWWVTPLLSLVLCFLLTTVMKSSLYQKIELLRLVVRSSIAYQLWLHG